MIEISLCKLSTAWTYPSAIARRKDIINPNWVLLEHHCYPDSRWNHYPGENVERTVLLKLRRRCLIRLSASFVNLAFHRCTESWWMPLLMKPLRGQFSMQLLIPFKIACLTWVKPCTFSLTILESLR